MTTKDQERQAIAKIRRIVEVQGATGTTLAWDSVQKHQMNL